MLSFSWLLRADHWYYAVQYFMFRTRSLNSETLARSPADRWNPPGCHGSHTMSLACHLTGGIHWWIWALFSNKFHFFSQAVSLATFRCDSKVLWKKPFLMVPIKSKPVLRNTTHSLINSQPSLHLYFVTPDCYSPEWDITFPGVEECKKSDCDSWQVRWVLLQCKQAFWSWASGSHLSAIADSAGLAAKSRSPVTLTWQMGVKYNSWQVRWATQGMFSCIFLGQSLCKRSVALPN